jgi:2-hydroxychromene-2-carboxylate isomerase
MREIEFLFDYISPNSYLAWARLPELAARHGAIVRPVPVLFAGFLQAYGQLGPAEVPPKMAWMNRDTLRKAQLMRLPFAPPFRHPFNPLLVLRLTAQELDESVRARITTVLLQAIWSERLDAEDGAAVGACLRAAGIDAEPLLAATADAEVKARVRANTERAIAAGAFGVPSMLVDGQLFWGYDDLPQLERLLAGTDPLATTDVAAFMSAWEDARRRGHHRDRA